MDIVAKLIFNSNTQVNEIQWLKITTNPKISFKAATIKMKMTLVDIFFFR